MNVIVVGWGILASDAYPVAAKNTRLVGEYLGEFLEFLNRDSNLEYKDVHISGHSLGSYVAGFAGAYHDGHVGRITGIKNRMIAYHHSYMLKQLRSSRASTKNILRISLNIF